MTVFLNFPFLLSWYLLCFFFRRSLHREICKSKLPVVKIFKNTKKGIFARQNLTLLTSFFSFFPPPILSAHPRALFWTPKLWLGTQNKDFQWSLPSDHKLSFLCGSKQLPIGLKQSVRFKAIYCPLKIYKVDALIFFSEVLKVLYAWVIVSNSFNIFHILENIHIRVSMIKKKLMHYKLSLRCAV